jgi:uncharacterized delta-60 repeat protein
LGGGSGFVNAAQQGTVDTAFGSGGKAVIPFDLVFGGWDAAEAVAVQRDGKIVVVGGAEQLGLDYDFAVLRLEPDGDLDLTFGTGGKTLVPFNLGGLKRDIASAVAIQSDGAIIIAGEVSGTDVDVEFGIVRLDKNGALDPTFGVGGMTTVAFDLGGAKDDYPWDIAIQDDGKIVVVGGVDGSLGNDDFGVVRLTSGGARDVTFGSNGIRVVFFDLGSSNNDVAFAVAIQPTGEILLAGQVAVSLGNLDMGVVRLNSNSTDDFTFGTGGKVRVAFDLVAGGSDPALDLVLQADGKILLAGGAETVGGDRDFAVARLGTNGVLDGTFSGDGKTTVAFDLGGSEEDFVFGIALEADGRIVVGGRADGPNGDRDFGVARFDANGTLDTDFGNSGTMTVAFDLGGGEDFLQGLAVPPTGGIFLVGAADVAVGGSDFAVAKVNGMTIFADVFETGDTSVWSTTVP